ncbi:MAG: aminoacyl-tRNA hydrolase [Clostridiaceae bacterium]|nr:aminoacyl-tRNA hydrolase [Clostridiaceae bacterium]
MEKKEWLIVGLGNPGKRYDRTWHNVGRMAVETLATRHSIRISRRRFRGLMGEGMVGCERVRFLLPNTYMNLSGESVTRAMAFGRISPERVIVLYDDFDLALGHIRVRDQGGAGGHNGMKSILNHLKNDHFPRVRIGIGPPPCEDTIDFVLGKIPAAKMNTLQEAILDACDAVELIIQGQQQVAQERFNKKG